jgi:CheY-like chemotaxis protein
LLGGELKLQSAVGAGSTFTFYLPFNYVPASESIEPLASRALRARGEERPGTIVDSVADDRELLDTQRPTLLIVEDDARYAMVLRDLARAHGFQVIVAQHGADAVRMAQQYSPSAISLDVFLPDMLGWAVLARLKHNMNTRHIPVQIVTVDEERHSSLERGAFAFLAKPATTESIGDALERIRVYTLARTKRLLVVEDDSRERSSIEQLIHGEDVEIDSAETGAEALAKLAETRYDCIVLDLRLPDMSGFELLERIQIQQGLSDVPIIVFTGRELSSDEDRQLRRAAKSVIVKGVESPERLLDETALFLHRNVANMPVMQQTIVRRLHESDDVLRRKRVLVVDDDVRNIFAMSSILERHGMEVITAGTGQEAVEKVAADADIDLVMMDIMMPGMDGYDTMRAIRARPESRNLPIVALTAKAMKGDREKCLEAGASDYLAKPVVTDQLLGVLRQWLHR